MSTIALIAANDDFDPRRSADRVSQRLSGRRLARHLMIVGTVISVATLTLTMVHGWQVLATPPDATFAFRV